MKRADKEQLVIELKEKLEGATALYYTDFTGLNVKRMTDLLRSLRLKSLSGQLESFLRGQLAQDVVIVIEQQQ